MSQALLIALAVYLTACYAYGIYLAVRLFTGRLLRSASNAPAGSADTFPTQDMDPVKDPAKIAA